MMIVTYKPQNGLPYMGTCCSICCLRDCR